MLTEQGHRLVEDNLKLVEKATKSHWKYYAVLPPEEMKSVLYLALVQAAIRWPVYCEMNGYDPNDEHYFPGYVTPRLNGAVMDELRKLDSVRRAQRDKLKKNGDNANNILAGYRFRTHVLIPAETLNAIEKHQDDMDSQLAVAEITKTMQELIRKLPYEDQIVLALKYYRGLDHKDIAKELRRSTVWVTERHKTATLLLLQEIRSTI